MSSGINKVIIVGNLGNDPETRSFPDGSMVANISVATSETWTDRQTGQRQERTEWHRIVLRDRGNYKLAQNAAQYLRKGSKVYVEGKLQTRKWQDQQGVDKYTTEIIADTLQFLDGRSAGQEGNMAQAQAAYAPSMQAAPAYQQQPPAMSAQVPPQANYAQPSAQQQGGFAPQQAVAAPQMAPPQQYQAQTAPQPSAMPAQNQNYGTMPNAAPTSNYQAPNQASTDFDDDIPF